MGTKQSTIPLTETHPSLAAQAHGWDPSELSIGSGRRRMWKCARGHVWEAVVFSRRTRGCPFCSGKRPIEGETDLASTHPEVAAQAVGFDPTKVTARSNLRVDWCCPSGHAWSATVDSRTKSGCPQCVDHKSIRGSVLDEYPEVAAQANGWDPSHVTSGSHAILAWKCARGHTWSSVVKNRTLIGTGCPYCAGKLPIVGQTDLASVYPAVAAEANGWDPTTVLARSGLKREWKCALGHVWTTTIAARKVSGCPNCYRQDRFGLST